MQDDTTIIAEDPNDLELLMNKVKHANAEVGLELNLAKTKIMTTGENLIFKIDGQVLETVECYTFLDSIVTKDGMCTKQIKRRKSAMSKLEKILKDKNLTKQTKIKITQILVSYESESWTMRKKGRKNLMLLNYWYGGKFKKCRGQKGKQIKKFFRK